MNVIINYSLFTFGEEVALEKNKLDYFFDIVLEKRIRIRIKKN